MTTVLLVDDNPKYLKDALPHYGYDVFTAADGIQALKILAENKFDIIINTVPYIILGKKELKLIDKNTLIIDLASSPGGVDKEYAQKEKLNLIVALGIPGRETPKTAAKYIKKIISKNIV